MKSKPFSTLSINFFYLCFLTFFNVYTISAQGECSPLESFMNGGFEEQSGCNPNDYGCISHAFNDGCVGGWGAANGSPDVCFQFNNAINPFEGELNASLGCKNASGCKNESIFANVELDLNKTYKISFNHRIAHFANSNEIGPVDVRIFLTSGLTNVSSVELGNCSDIFPPPSTHVEIYKSLNFSATNWSEVVIDKITPVPGLDQILFVPVSASNSLATTYWLLDAIKIEECECDPDVSCEEFTNLTACSENGKTGYIDISCGAGSEYSVVIPGTSNANIYKSEGHLIITNANAGDYTVFVTDANGCIFERNYTVVESCCEIVQPCTPPQNLGCFILFGETYLRWEDVPGATSYLLDIYPGDCGISTGPGTTIPLNDNRYNIANINSKSFSWSVRSVCEDEVQSDYSQIVCFDSDECDGFGLQGTGSAFSQADDQNVDLDPLVYPNPSRGELTFNLTAPSALEVTTEIHSADGKLVKTLDKEIHSDGVFNQVWKADANLENGIFYVTFKTNFGVFQEKVIILK